MENNATHNKVIVLTGGPGGGKTTLIKELCTIPEYANHIISLPEAVFYALQTGISPIEPVFQRLMVEIQSGMEDAVATCFPDKIILCHRGTLDPIAYWLNAGRPETDFYTLTNTSQQQHYDRYTAVIHLQTAAVNAQSAYQYYPNAHRGEPPDKAARLDELLYEVWRDHPRYHFIKSSPDWEEKRACYFKIMDKIIKS